MNINDKQQALIEKFLDDNLSGIQKEAFDLELKKDDFRKQLLFQAQVIDTHRSIEQDNLLNQLETFAQANKKQPKSKWNLGLLIGIIVLSLLFYALVFNATPTTKGQALYAEYLVELPADVNQRGGEVDVQTNAFKTAMQAYVNKDYENAYRGLKAMNPQTNTSKLYRAICAMHLGNDESAIGLLRPLLNVTETSIQENAQWYLALIWLRENQFSEASELLQVIAEVEAHLFYNKAIDLQKKIAD